MDPDFSYTEGPLSVGVVNSIFSGSWRVKFKFFVRALNSSSTLNWGHACEIYLIEINNSSEVKAFEAAIDLFEK